jgi:hypothetical protein
MAYVGGMQNLGRISPSLPGSTAKLGVGNSVNNGDGPEAPGYPGEPPTGGCSGTIQPGCCCTVLGFVRGGVDPGDQCIIHANPNELTCSEWLDLKCWQAGCLASNDELVCSDCPCSTDGTGPGHQGECTTCGDGNGLPTPTDDTGFPGQPYGWGPPRGGGGALTGTYYGSLVGEVIMGFLLLHLTPGMNPFPKPGFDDWNRYYDLSNRNQDDKILNNAWDKAYQCLANYTGPHANCLRSAMRKNVYIVDNSLPEGTEGLTNPFGWTIRIKTSELSQYSECEFLRTILHETAHQCWVVGREFFIPLMHFIYWAYENEIVNERGWYNTWNWFYGEDAKGRGTNAANRVADAVLNNSCCCDGTPGSAVNFLK